jgi:uncharacterized phage protein (TIGR01671 family)
MKKFRKWNEDKKEFEFSNLYTGVEDQFIEILDQDGKEIYENDIVKELTPEGSDYEYSSVGVVKYLPDCAGYSLRWPGSKVYRYDLHLIQGLMGGNWKDGHGNPAQDCKTNSKRLRIIGNLQENYNIITERNEDSQRKREWLAAEREAAILSLIAPDKAKETSDHYGRKLKFIYKGKKYWMYPDHDKEHHGGGSIQSYEWRPNFEMKREVCGIEFRAGGMSSNPNLIDRVVWDPQVGYLDFEQWGKFIKVIESKL